MKELKKTIKERGEENERLSQDAENKNVSVNERRHIHEVNGGYYIIIIINRCKSRKQQLTALNYLLRDSCLERHHNVYMKSMVIIISYCYV